MEKIKLHLLVDEDYIDSFVALLPADKVRIVEADFEKNRVKLQETLEEYLNNGDEFKEYYESMKDISSWLDLRENK